MTGAILASWLVSQQWAWQRSPADESVTAYRIYWSDLATIWCTTSRLELPASTSCGLARGCPDDATCCGEIPIPPAALSFILITAVNAAGESGTDHGPVTVCP